MLFFGSDGLEFKVAHMHLLLCGEEVRLDPCMALSTGVDLFAQDPQPAFLIFALFSNRVEAFTALCKTGLQFGLFQRQTLNGFFQLSTALCITNRLGEFSRTFADLMFQFVDSTNQPLGA